MFYLRQLFSKAGIHSSDETMHMELQFIIDRLFV